jgi:ribonuclease Z
MSSKALVRGFFVVLVLAILAVGSYTVGRADERRGADSPLVAVAAAQSQEPLISPTGVRVAREAYFPNSEELGPDEMRVISCGTGMPTGRESQAAACFLVELGNGDKFIFDSGTGSHVRIASMEIPYDFLDKIFLSHLHTDHFGDFAAYYIGGWVAGRTVPLRVWGPSGSAPDLGTDYALNRWREALNWDITNRRGRLPASGGELQITEFDYKGENHVVYQENGVTIRAWPAIHGIDGSVSYRLEWNGLSFVFGGDTYPNQWFVEYAQGADLVVHEAMMAVEDYIRKFKFPPGLALEIGVNIHTSPESFGKVMSLVQPRMAVAYHFFNDFDTRERIGLGIRSTYDGPLTMATDYMVWNVTRDALEVREVHFNPDVWPPPAAYPKPDIDQAGMVFVSDEINSRRLPEAADVDQAIYDRINAQYGTNFRLGR